MAGDAKFGRTKCLAILRVNIEGIESMYGCNRLAAHVGAHVTRGGIRFDRAGLPIRCPECGDPKHAAESCDVEG